MINLKIIETIKDSTIIKKIYAAINDRILEAAAPPHPLFGESLVCLDSIHLEITEIYEAYKLKNCDGRLGLNLQIICDNFIQINRKHRRQIHIIRINHPDGTMNLDYTAILKSRPHKELIAIIE